MHILYTREEETERGEKKKYSLCVCVVSVGLTSDLAEYG